MSGISTTQGTTSLSDCLTALQNLVRAVNAAAQTYANVNGVSTTENITAPTVIKTSPGRACRLSVITAGSSTGMIYDAVQTTNTKAPIWVIPEAAATDGEPYAVGMATDAGIMVVPGTGQSVTLLWS